MNLLKIVIQMFPFRAEYIKKHDWNKLYLLFPNQIRYSIALVKSSNIIYYRSYKHSITVWPTSPAINISLLCRVHATRIIPAKSTHHVVVVGSFQTALFDLSQFTIRDRFIDPWTSKFPFRVNNASAMVLVLFSAHALIWIRRAHFSKGRIIRCNRYICISDDSPFLDYECRAHH